MKLTIGIIDDELHAIETLIYDLREMHGDEIEILFTTTDPFVGARAARTINPDVLFLDMVMPGLSGIELYKLIDDLNIFVVFITAYVEFSSLVKKTNAFAYLSKPMMSHELKEVFKRLLLSKATF